jgi:hypothetical protein
VAEHLVLGDEGRGDVLRDHEAGVEPALDREEGRQALGQRRVDQPLDTSLGDAGQLGDGHRERIEPECERLAVEVPVRDDELLVQQHEWVVGGGVHLHRDGRVDVREQIAARAVHLRGAAQRVGVLHLVAPAVGLDDRRPFQEPQHVRGGVPLSGQGPGAVDGRMEARPRSLQRLE